MRTLVTAGGTREPIDAVRYIGNRSSGRHGVRARRRRRRPRGRRSSSSPPTSALPRRAGVRYVDVGSAAELAAACEREFDAADVLVMCAAVADFGPVGAVDGQDRQVGDGAADARARADDRRARDAVGAAARPGQTLVGFAAEHGEGALERARARSSSASASTRSSATTSRTPAIGFDSERNAVTIITRRARASTSAPADKRAIAEAVLDAVEALRA